MNQPIEVLPDDEHNRELVRQTHPPDWKNPTPDGKYDLVAIGGGTAGIISALFPAGLDGKSALIEKHLLGGDCLNFGCVPSKALIRAARAASELAGAGEFGLPTANHEFGAIAFEQVMQRMRRLRARISHHDSAERFTSLGVDVYLGEAKFVNETAVEVAGATLEFKRCVLATGARAFVPPIEGIDSAPFLTNETIFSLTELPRRFLVVGGGPIGSEMAQAFRRFGSEVHLIDRAPRILNRESRAAAEVVQQQFEQEGIHLHLETGVERIAKTDSGVTLTLKRGDETTTLEGDAVLMAVGRKPNYEGLDLENAGVQTNDRGVVVSDKLQTSNPRIYAAGDIAGGYQFTHAADAMARMCIRNAFFFGGQRVSNMVVPRTTYTEPELAHVGKTPEELAEEGIEFDTFRAEFAENDRAILDGETQGFAAAYCKKDTGVLLGATIVGAHAGNLIGEMSLMMTRKLSLGTLGSVIHCYPTQAEILKRLGDAYSKTLLTPFRKRVLQWIMSWRS